MRLAATAAFAILALVGCGEKTAAPPPTTDEPAPAEAIAQVRMVDLEGRPLANIMPIATAAPNAFEEPVARGPLTGADGVAAFAMPSRDLLYIRGWDPTGRMFANNYFEAHPQQGGRTKLMEIVMVQAASLELTLVDAAEQPLADTEARLMMFHPVEGPWWPAQAKTDANGHVRFAPVPPGIYTTEVRAREGGRIEIPDVSLPPGGKAALGVVALERE